MLVLSNIPPSKIPVPESPVSAQSQRRGKSPSSYVSLRHLQLGLKPHSHPWTKHLNKWAWQQTRRILRNPNDTELKSNWLMLEAVSVGKNQWELCQKQPSSENLKLQMKQLSSATHLQMPTAGSQTAWEESKASEADKFQFQNTCWCAEEDEFTVAALLPAHVHAQLPAKEERWKA